MWHTLHDTVGAWYGAGMPLPSAPFRPDPKCLQDPAWAAAHPTMCRAYYNPGFGLTGPGGGGHGGFLGGLLHGLTGGLL